MLIHTRTTHLRKTGPGALACALFTCVVAPPVRGAGDGAQSSDGGGCNGGRKIEFDDESGADTTSAESSSTDDTGTTAGGVCGDGVVDAGEGCDDGNKVDEDGCPSGAKGQCAGAAKCGDGIVWEMEEACDGEEGCQGDCTYPPAECGNGVTEPGEGCDDENVEDGDGCPSGAVGQCKAEASCGDGVVWAGVEVCDDGNTEETDECPSGVVGQCKKKAECGDGFVLAGVEDCDDGNMEDTDECPSGTGACVAAAKCGDGFVQAGFEGCDDGNAEDLDGCSNMCVAPRWVFVTSGLNVGNVGGVTGADNYCQTQAEAAGLAGTYMAWLTGADPNSAPATRFGSTEFTGWYRLPSEPPTAVAQGWADLTSPNDDMPASYLQSAIYVSEAGSPLDDAFVWTNTKSDGTQATKEMHCLDWSSSAIEVKGWTGRAKPELTSDVWTMFSENACANGVRLYCFQVQ